MAFRVLPPREAEYFGWGRRLDYCPTCGDGVLTRGSSVYGRVFRVSGKRRFTALAVDWLLRPGLLMLHGVDFHFTAVKWLTLIGWLRRGIRGFARGGHFRVRLPWRVGGDGWDVGVARCWSVFVASGCAVDAGSLRVRVASSRERVHVATGVAGCRPGDGELVYRNVAVSGTKRVCTRVFGALR
jgi:hypothetical protein